MNPIIGDAGFKHFHFNINPDLFSFLSLFSSETFENLRIKSHLLYAHNLLAAKDCHEIPEEEKLRRKSGLQDLQNYALLCKFPKNYDAWERTPAFVDKEGTLCAVAHIINKSGHDKLVHEVDKLFHNHRINNMKDHAGLEEWVAKSGFTLSEIAMIQPGYPPIQYGFSTLFYIFMCLIIGVSAVVQYRDAPSPSPPHYKSILLALIINNFVGLLFSMIACVGATLTKTFFSAIILSLRLIWCTSNLALLSYYIANISNNDPVPYMTTKLMKVGLGFTVVCFAISAACDICGVFVQIQLEEMAENRRERRKNAGPPERIEDIVKQKEEVSEGEKLEGVVSVEVKQEVSV